MDYNKIGAIIIIILMSFFINIFYYLSWMITDYWLTGSSNSLVEGATSKKLPTL